MDTGPRAGHPNAKSESRSEEHTSELQSHVNLVCRLLLEKKKLPRSGKTTKDEGSRPLFSASTPSAASSKSLAILDPAPPALLPPPAPHPHPPHAHAYSPA